MLYNNYESETHKITLCFSGFAIKVSINLKVGFKFSMPSKSWLWSFRVVFFKNIRHNGSKMSYSLCTYHIVVVIYSICKRKPFSHELSRQWTSTLSKRHNWNPSKKSYIYLHCVCILPFSTAWNLSELRTWIVDEFTNAANIVSL